MALILGVSISTICLADNKARLDELNKAAQQTYLKMQDAQAMVTKCQAELSEIKGAIQEEQYIENSNVSLPKEPKLNPDVPLPKGAQELIDKAKGEKK